MQQPCDLVCCQRSEVNALNDLSLQAKFTFESLPTLESASHQICKVDYAEHLLNHCSGPLRYIKLCMDSLRLMSILGFRYQDGNERSNKDDWQRNKSGNVSANICIEATEKGG